MKTALFLAELSSVQIGIIVCIVIVTAIFVIARTARNRVALPTTVTDTETELRELGLQIENTLNNRTMFVRETDRDKALHRLELRKKSLDRHLKRLRARIEPGCVT